MHLIVQCLILIRIFLLQDGDKGHEFRTFAEIVTIPDSEMLLVSLQQTYNLNTTNINNSVAVFMAYDNCLVILLCL